MCRRRCKIRHPAGTPAILTIRSTIRVGVAGAAAVDLRTYPLSYPSSTNWARAFFEAADGGSGAAEATATLSQSLGSHSRARRHRSGSTQPTTPRPLPREGLFAARALAAPPPRQNPVLCGRSRAPSPRTRKCAAEPGDFGDWTGVEAVQDLVRDLPAPWRVLRGRWSRVAW